MTVPKNISERVSWAVKFAWDITTDKIVNGELKINKEASLQLHYASILKNITDLIKLSPSERFEIDLETTVYIGKKSYLIDITISYTDGIRLTEKHAVELKCYKTLSSSGNNRGAGDIFMYGVYLDLYYSELYLENCLVNYCTCLVLTDYRNFVYPKSKKTKNWVYDISHGHILEGSHYTTSIGGRAVDFKLAKKYHFDWINKGHIWTAMLRPVV